MKKLKLITIYIIIIITITINMPINATFAKDNTFTILILNSYNSFSQWENYMVSTIMNNLQDKNHIVVKLDYLDSRNRFDNDYKNNFNDLLSLKYQDETFDAFIVIDDEAYNYAKDRLFDENSIFYKKSIVFTGINSDLNVNENEKPYITGVYDIEDNITFLNLLFKLHPNINRINYLLNNSIYSTVIKASVEQLLNTLPPDVEINFIKDEYLDNILNNPLLDGLNTTVNIVVGDFKDITTDGSVPLDKIIKLLQKKSPTPIYTKTQPYIDSGSIGGIVDWGDEQGNLIANIIDTISNGVSVSEIPIIVKAIEKVVFDYSLLLKYNINPLKLPKNTIFINKGFLDFLMPKPLLILTWTLMLLSVFILFSFIIKYIKRKKEATKTKFLYQQMQIEENLKNEFISTISHELRTPINIILNSAKLIEITSENNNLNKSSLHKNLSFITLNSNRLLRLINNIIDIPKLNSGFITPNFTTVNIIDLIESTVDSVIPFAKAHHINIIFDTEVEELITSTDIEKLERIILNLLSNSIKFTESFGNIFVAVKVIDDDNLDLIIQDTGVGIPKDQLDNIFNKFYQVDNSLSRVNEGSGLGLYIVKSLIIIIGATINIHSVVNIGTTITITLPIIPIATEPDSIPMLDNLNNRVNIELSDLK